MYEYKYPHPAVTADCVVFAPDAEGRLNVLLVQRGSEPYKGCWAFPGGFMNIDESAEQCAVRELEEETGLRVSDIRQVGCFSAVDRDPRERVLTVAFWCRLERMEAVCGADDAACAHWFAVDEVPPLAFDHPLILQQALEGMRRKCQC